MTTKATARTTTELKTETTIAIIFPAKNRRSSETCYVTLTYHKYFFLENLF
ncbi:hypothetical protein HanRHA438_Chr12g0555611 [Helianthus annuus]|nr:hypothetical protein HanRHA438_Chr12g0555611 [Helianthus annuus]